MALRNALCLGDKWFTNENVFGPFVNDSKHKTKYQGEDLLTEVNKISGEIFWR